MCVAITSISQHNARWFEECNRGLLSPQVLPKLDHHVVSDAAEVAAAARAAPARWLPPTGLWHFCDSPGKWGIG